ncbi:MAG: class I SAM-dependent methyltransferase family protein [Candidatus Bathyarchaeota archaeon]|nr:MAG: class I SAM-dependent methyltransferase family protein [Candidatus Bathyarchaeota archaeon]
MSRELRSELRGSMPDCLIDIVPRSFDVVGSKQKAVAILEFPEGLEGHRKLIAEAIMRMQKNIVSVLAKASAREGEFRTRELELIAGDPDTEVLHKESGCVYRLDPRTVYFSPRESMERARIASAVKDGEEVLVMFSGVGPFPICMAKRHEDVRATAIELNPHAHNYCVENVHLNRVADRVEPILGDVRFVSRRLDRLYDRILMPLPKGAYKFLDVAVPLLKDGGVLNFYHWAPADDLYGEAERLVTKVFNSGGLGVEFVDHVRVSQYSPRYWKVRIDAKAHST